MFKLFNKSIIKGRPQWLWIDEAGNKIRRYLTESGVQYQYIDSHGGIYDLEARNLNEAKQEFRQHKEDK